ncbi:Kdo domain containing protein [Flavobacterium sp.]|uniref:Kdo domain containing protein n=1 Tax=Flavobacterium sp. TaxID=239 RepID=UPI00374D406D
MDKELFSIIKNFHSQGDDFIVGKRNHIKTFPFNNMVINVKSFKIPSLFFGIIYKFLRQSKAKRSYFYSKKLIECNIGTPKPLAFYENKTWLRLLDSYYVCEHLQVDYVFKDLFNKNFDELLVVLKQFAHFTFQLHESGIEFLDHSPGNTLIKEVSKDEFEFYLVDLNRMKFHTNMSFETRMKNFSRITPSESMIKVISSEYAKLYGKREDEVFNLMWKYVSQFQNRKTLKNKIKKIFNI